MSLIERIAGKARWRALEGVNFFSGVLQGMSASASVRISRDYGYPHASVEDALRSDWDRIGGDFDVAMKRTREEASPRK